jgi:hypothetical protein
MDFVTFTGKLLVRTFVPANPAVKSHLVPEHAQRVRFLHAGRCHHVSALIQAPQTDSTSSESGRASSGWCGKENLFADVETFQKPSLSGKYYQAFAVNSGNYTEKSSATLAWIAAAFLSAV